MRIVLPIHSFEPGGVERVALRLAARWHSSGEDVTVVLGRDEGPARIDEANGLTFRTYRSLVRTARFETIWMMLCLYRYLRTEPADVIFCPGNTYTVVCAAMRLLLGHKCPPVLAKVSNDLCRSDLPTLYRLAYGAWVRAHTHFIGRFIALAGPMANEIAEETGVSASRIAVIPDPALTEEEFHRLAAIDRKPPPARGAQIIAVGRLVPQKNLALLLEAFADHSEASDRLQIAGEGPELPRLTRLAIALKVQNRVTFMSHCSNVFSLLDRADIFALSSDYEGLPAVLIEALAAGLPIVATDCSSSIRWLTGFGRDGLVVPRGDADKFGRALREVRSVVIPSPEGRLRAAHFTLEQAARSYLQQFRILADANRRTLRKKNCRPH